MNFIMELLVAHGCAALFAVVLVEQLGFPIPASPFLIAAGALAGLGQLNLLESLVFVVIAAVGSDLVWFFIARRGGEMVSPLLARLPQNLRGCAADVGTRSPHFTIGSLIVAKFVPVLNILTPVRAGMCGLELRRYLAPDLIAAAFWAVTYLGLGWTFCGELERVVTITGRLGELAGALIFIGVVAAHVNWRSLRWNRPLKRAV